MPTAHTNVTDTGGAESAIVEEEFQVKLPGGGFIGFRITIASVPKVGPGPRPNMEEIFLVRRIGEEQVLTISAELFRATAAPKVGSGGPPTGGN
ncbi:MAG: hypothetical protein ACREO7_10485 [Pseudoxanthomonas sp.]